MAQSTVVDRTYATVNGELIAQSDIPNYKKQLKKRLLYEDLLFPDEKAIDRALKDKDFLVRQIMNEKMIDAEAKKLGINITDERINKEIKNKGGVGQLTQLLNQQGLRLIDYKNFLKKSLARREVVNYFVTSKIKISDEDILDFYVSKSGGKATSQSFEYDIDHVLFSFNTKAEKKKAMAKAKSALADLSSLSFLEVHKKYNGEEELSFGKFKTGEMLSSIEQPISQLKSGEHSPVIESPMGLHIFFLKEKGIVDNPDFRRVKKQIYQILFAQTYKEQLDYWLYGLKKNAIIKKNS